MADNERLNQLVEEAKQAAQEVRAAIEPKLDELGAQVAQRVEKGIQAISDKLDQLLDELGAAI